ncbi:MAG: cell division protein FtsX [Alphaproteobacteria bacterium]
MARSIDFLPTEIIRGRLLPWVIGVMVFLSGLALVSAAGLQSMAQTWRAGLEYSLTVQLAGPDPQILDAEAAAALKVLRDEPAVLNAERLSADAMRSLLEPWLGTQADTDSLPLPLLIDVTLTPGAAIDLEALTGRVRAAAPSARVDGHDRWLTDLVTLARLVQGLSIIVVALIVLATITVIVFATRAGLAAQRETVAIVHLMGAEDKQIASAFQRRFLLVGLQGAFLGLLGLAAIFAGAYIVSETITTDVLPSFVPSPPVLAGLLSLPVPAALLSMLTARLTVGRALGEMN